MGGNKKIDDGLMALQMITPEWLRMMAEYQVYRIGFDYYTRGMAGSVYIWKRRGSAIVNSYDVEMFRDGEEEKQEGCENGVFMFAPACKAVEILQARGGAGLSIHRRYRSIIEREILEDRIIQANPATPKKNVICTHPRTCLLCLKPQIPNFYGT